MKLLIDTSAWIEHLKGNTEAIREILLDEGTVLLTHSSVIAELMLGGIKSGSEVLVLLNKQEKAIEATSSELLIFIEKYNIIGKGVGIVDCGLLMSCLLSDAALLTYDKKLRELASLLRIRTLG